VALVPISRAGAVDEIPRHSGIRRNMKIELKPRYKISRDEKHAYTIDDGKSVRTFPGVTGILDIVGSKEKTNMLMGWAKKHALLKVAEHIRTFAGKQLVVDEAWIESVRKSAWKRDKELLKEAGDIGTRVHDAIDAYIKGEEPILDDVSRPGYDNFRKWLDTSGVEMLAGDTYVAHCQLGYGGAMDALGKIGDSLVLFDWKTSNSMRETYPLQAAAYALAFEDTYPKHNISRAFVIRIGKEKPGDIEPKEVNLRAAKTAWLSAVALNTAMKEATWI
jgi:hypothetical protein